jgi:hypothetical protein
VEVLDGVGQWPDTVTQSGWRVSYRISRPEALAQAADRTAAVKTEVETIKITICRLWLSSLFNFDFVGASLGRNRGHCDVRNGPFLGQKPHCLCVPRLWVSKKKFALNQFEVGGHYPNL